MQTEFVEFLEAADGCETVIVELPDPGRVSPEMTRMLQTWQRITLLAERKFRMNGVSRTVHQVLGPRSHRFSTGRRPAFGRQRIALESRENAALEFLADSCATI
jgi:hypothetical protein